MSTFNKNNNNTRPFKTVSTHGENGIMAIRRKLGMFPAIFALLLMSALLLVWLPGQASAAAEAPKFESLTTSAVI
ncbi:MAG: hypothetical protein O2913_07530 [Chloroflexi bacterium]|nr:hypothetical protein [Chloroflexota bacterium]